MTGSVTLEYLAEARRALGRQLASLREAAGLTQAQLARATGYTRSAIANVETGRSSQPRASWSRYDQLLKANGALIAGYDSYATIIEQHRQQATQERERHRAAKIERWRESLDDLGSANVDSPPARHGDTATSKNTVGDLASARWPPVALEGTPEFEGNAARPEVPLAAISRYSPEGLVFETALAGPTGERGAQPSPAHLSELSKISIHKPLPARISWLDVEHVRSITRMFAMSENVYGGGLSGEAAAAQLRHSASLLEVRATKDVRRAMFEAVGNLSEVVGFSAFDIADYTSAHRCFDFSLWCAYQGGSWSLRASALSDMSRLATYLGRIDDALSLIEFAQVRADRISATARAMLSAVRARLLALQGRYPDARAEIDRSDGYFAERSAAEDPPWLCYYDQAEHEGSTGRALIPIAASTGDLSLVVPRLEAAVRLHDVHYPRSREFSRTRLASLLMKVGDVKEAVALGYTVLAESASLRSNRLYSEIRKLGDLAADHDHVPEVAELRQEVMALTETDRT